MIRTRLFGRCRIYHDPVSPVLKARRRSGGMPGSGVLISLPRSPSEAKNS